MVCTRVLGLARNGLGVPEAVAKATSEYRQDENPASFFIAEQCIVGPGPRIKSSDLYRAYCAFTERSGDRSVNQKRFGQAMTELKFERDRNDGIWYLGIDLRKEPKAPPEGQQTSGVDT